MTQDGKFKKNLLFSPYMPEIFWTRVKSMEAKIICEKDLKTIFYMYQAREWYQIWISFQTEIQNIFTYTVKSQELHKAIIILDSEKKNKKEIYIIMKINAWLYLN